jgi:hypothetical protein
MRLRLGISYSPKLQMKQKPIITREMRKSVMQDNAASGTRLSLRIARRMTLKMNYL